MPKFLRLFCKKFLHLYRKLYFIIKVASRLALCDLGMHRWLVGASIFQGDTRHLCPGCVGAVTVWVKGTDRGGSMRTCVPWSAMVTCPTCVPVSWTVRTTTAVSFVGGGDVCVALSQATLASSSGGCVPGSLSKVGRVPSSRLRANNIVSQASWSRKVTGEPDP